MTTSVVGIDIGSGTLRAVEVRDPDTARPTLVRHFEVPVPTGAVSRGEVLEPNTVAESLKHLWSKGGFKSKNVVLGMGNQRVLARDLSVPKASLKHIRESLPFQVQDMLPVPVAEALLDFYPVSETMGDHGPMVNGLLVAAVKDAVLGNVKAVQLAGLAVVGVDLIPFALSRVLLRRGVGGGAVALIDVGANTTSVVVAVQGVPQFVRIIPAGGDDLTQALAARLDIDVEQAEGIKRSLGLVAPAATSEQRLSLGIIHEASRELLNSLRNTVTYFMNTRPQDRVIRIVLTGGGAQLPGFANALGEIIGLPVVAGNPFGTIALARGLNAEELGHSRQTLTVALGLATRRAA